jgi:hypothetical protein
MGALGKLIAGYFIGDHIKSLFYQCHMNKTYENFTK